MFKCVYYSISLSFMNVSVIGFRQFIGNWKRFRPTHYLSNLKCRLSLVWFKRGNRRKPHRASSVPCPSFKTDTSRA